MLKRLPILILLLILSFFVLTQIRHVSAVEPLTSPVTPPVTSPTPTPTDTPTPTPITPPVTTPSIDFDLSGTVVYKHLGRLFGNMTRIVPAGNILVTVENFFNRQQKFTTHTDADGKYALDIPNGLYIVKVGDTSHTFFVPPIKVVKIKDNQKVANFQGLLFPHF